MKKKSMVMTLAGTAAVAALTFVGAAPAMAFTGAYTVNHTCASNQQVVAWVDPSGSGLGTISISPAKGQALVVNVDNRGGGPGSYVKAKSGISKAFVELRSGTATSSYGVACEAK